MARARKKAPPATIVFNKPKKRGRRTFWIPDSTWEKVLIEYNNGWTIAELAIRLGCNYKTLQQRFQKQGISKPKGNRNLAKQRHNNLVRRPVQQELLTQAKLNAKEAELMTLSPDPDFNFDSLLEEEF